MLLRSGEKVGRYRVVDVLAMTGISVVYKADGKRGPVVLKTLLDPASMPVLRSRMRAESKFRFGSPFLLDPVDWVSTRQGEYIVFPFIEGYSLQDVLDHGIAMSVQESVFICLCLLKGLAVMHHRGLIHTDVKPGNLMLSAKGDKAILIDYSNFEVDGRRPDISRGTLPYASPELLRRERLTPASDLYSAGGVLFQCLTGKPPHEGADEADVEKRVLAGDPVDLAAVRALDSEVAEVVSDSLAQHARSRPRSSTEMYYRLRKIHGRLNGSQGTPAGSRLPERLAFLCTRGQAKHISLGDRLVLKRDDLDPDNSNLSREHAILSRRNGGYVVRDLGSTNGTFVNGVKVLSETPVHSGDEVRLANLVMRLL